MIAILWLPYHGCHIQAIHTIFHCLSSSLGRKGVTGEPGPRGPPGDPGIPGECHSNNQ